MSPAGLVKTPVSGPHLRVSGSVLARDLRIFISYKFSGSAGAAGTGTTF